MGTSDKSLRTRGLYRPVDYLRMNPDERALQPGSQPASAGASGKPVKPSLGNGYKSPERDGGGKQHKQLSEFWRAMRYVLPYRGLVAISIGCAFVVGLTVSGGLATMLPIMRVLLNGQTVADWANSQVVEHRLSVKLAEDSAAVRLVQVKVGRAADAGLKSGDQISIPGTPPGPAGASATLARLSSPAETSLTLTCDPGGPVTLSLPPVPWYLAAERQIAGRVSKHPVGAVSEVFGFLALLSIFGNCLKFFQEYLSDKAATLAVNDIRRRLYDRVLHVPLSHFGSYGTSDITSRLVQDAGALEQGFKTVLGQSIQQPITAAFAFGVALLMSWRLTLVIVIFGPLMAAIIKKFGKKMRRASRAALQKSSRMLGQIEGTLSGIRVVKGASAERFERRRYREIMSRLVAEQLKMSRIDAFSSPTLESLTLLMIGSIVLIATYMVCVSHSLDKDIFFLVMACLATIAESLRRLNKVNNVLQRSNAAATRIFEAMDLPVERERVGGQARSHPPENRQATEDQGHGTKDAAQRPRVKLRPISREIRFENITFAYPNA
ncbi:MAG TPA: ABC transporter transmembrane domain-containing protein, partial [Pirellulales bacterium]|nr:ABC transporter transmembrane domain-containing protein [Pirellulales bacterium]